MGSVFGRTVLARLLEAPELDLRSLVVPPSAPAGFPPVRIAADGHVALARSAGVDIVDHRSDDVVIDRLRAPAPDLLVCACYPLRISARLAGVARIACLNLHPSRLPRYRGPEPLFWQLRGGEEDTGVTVHQVDARIDAGAILADRFVPLTFGASRDALDAMLANAATTLLLDRLRAGRPLRYRQQDEPAATRQPMPGANDRVAFTRWPVRRAYAFLRGAAPAGSVFRVDGADGRTPVRETLALSERRVEGVIEQPDGTIVIGFDGGSIVARRA